MYLTLRQQVKHLSKNELKTSRTTLRQKRIARKRNNRINDYLSKAAIIINYCLNNDIGKLVFRI